MNVFDPQLTKIDFPNKAGAIYIFKGKYFTPARKEMNGVIAFRVFKCKEGYFSFSTVDSGGGFQYHNINSESIFEPVFIEGQFYEIN